LQTLLEASEQLSPSAVAWGWTCGEVVWLSSPGVRDAARRCGYQRPRSEMRSPVRVAGWQLGAVAAALAAAGDRGWRSGGVVSTRSGREWRSLDLAGDGDQEG
jgi:hypothetical protein